MSDTSLNAPGALAERASAEDADQFVMGDLGERRFGAVNWLGLWTLYKKEVRRFVKVAFQTVFAPVISTILFLLVFMVAFGADRPDINGAPFLVFLAPGLIMMSILNNAFANSSSSLVVSKVQGNVVDFLMPPLSPAEVSTAVVAGAATRGLVVGAVTAVTSWGVMAWSGHELTVAAPLALLYYAASASVLLGIFGAMGGIWSDKFDHLAAVTNFVLTPLAFLSGTFYSITRLPEALQTVSYWNPVFYLIDGFRYGFIGASDAPVMRGALIILVLNAMMGYALYRMFKSGYKLKS